MVKNPTCNAYKEYPEDTSKINAKHVGFLTRYKKWIKNEIKKVSTRKLFECNKLKSVCKLQNCVLNSGLENWTALFFEQEKAVK